MAWSKAPVHWEDAQNHYYSIVFSWDLAAFLETAQPEMDGKGTVIGGPAVEINKGLVPSWISTPTTTAPQLWRHNAEATRTTIGCVRRCKFCAVPTIEPVYRELKEWDVLPIITDNNLLAASTTHIDRVMDKLRHLRWCDFNQGLDARLLTKRHAEQLSRLKSPIIRMAFDSVKYETQFCRAIGLLMAEGIPKSAIRVYVLIGFDDTPEDALYRLQLIMRFGLTPTPMRYQPIDVIEKNAYVHPEWTNKELDRFMSYYSNLRYTSAVPFEEYRHHGQSKMGQVSMMTDRG